MPEDSRPNPIYNAEQVEKAVARFREAELPLAESLLASARLLLEDLTRFRQEVMQFRAEHGDPASRDFARLELNDLIYDLQDAIAPTIRAYNALLRDLDQGMGPPE